MPTPTSLWKKVTGPSAGLVQQHYVAQRLDDLKRRNPELEDQVLSVLTNPLITGFKLKAKKLTDPDALKAYGKVSAGLKAAEITINFKAENWFTEENKFDSYAQAYERTASNGRTAQLKGDALNPAVFRSKIDDKVTFKGLFGARDREGPQRGLSPGVQGMGRVRNQMEFLGAKQARLVPNPDDPSKNIAFAQSANQYFNPQTKQVFTALNYGRRPHGASTMYGRCHLVWKPSFKVNAMYYAGDTFAMADASKQVAYGMLGAIIAYAGVSLQMAIFKSCYFGEELPDDGNIDMLLEAHVFAAMTFAGNLKEVVLDKPYGAVIDANARKFANKHGAILRVAG